MPIPWRSIEGVAIVDGPLGGVVRDAEVSKAAVRGRAVGGVGREFEMIGG